MGQTYLSRLSRGGGLGGLVRLTRLIGLIGHWRTGLRSAGGQDRTFRVGQVGQRVAARALAVEELPALCSCSARFTSWTQRAMAASLTASERLSTQSMSLSSST